jgi:hypothetical protein
MEIELDTSQLQTSVAVAEVNEKIRQVAIETDMDSRRLAELKAVLAM